MSSFIKKYSFCIVVILLVVAGSFFLGFKFGVGRIPDIEKAYSVANKETGKPEKIDFSPYWKAWNILNEKFVAVATTTSSMTDQQKVWSSIQGLAQSTGDPYTVFFPPEESKMFESDISGNFEGVGMEIAIRDGVLTVVAPLKGTPAQKAGIRPGDKILKIDDTLTAKLSADEAVKIIRGKEGSKVTFTISRTEKKEPFDVVVTRGVINIPTIDTEQREDGVFVVKLYNFSAVSNNLFRDALKKFVESGYDKLVLDLRGNPGGYLEAAIDMASWFLPAGKVVVSEDFGRGKPQTIHRSAGYDVFNSNLKMAVLIDQGSASASEILAGALQEHGIAKLVGEKSYGKGSVQELVPITSDTSLKVTIARWLTPKGNSISANGLTPDVSVKITQKEFDAGKDPQMAKAVELLLSK